MKQQLSLKKLSAALLAVFWIAGGSAVAGEKGVAYVSHQDGGVSVIDLATMEQTGNLEIGASVPRGIGVTANGQWLVTANRGDSNISIVDTSGKKAPIFVAIGKNPEFVRVMDNRAYITYEPSAKAGPPPKPGSKEAMEAEEEEKIPGHIAIVDLMKGKIVMDITGKPETEGLEFSADGKQLIVTNESDNSITVHDLKTGKLMKSVAVGQYGDRPRGIKMSPDGKTLVTTLEYGDKMLVLNDKYEVIKQVPTGKTPYGVSFDRKGERIFVAANREQTLEVFDAKTFEKIKDVKSTGKRCWHFTFTPDDQHILLTCGRSDEVVVIDANKLEVTKRIPSKGMPWGVVTYPKSMGSLDRP